MVSRSIVAGALGVLMAVLGAGAATAAVTPVATEVYTRPARMIEVEPGRRLNLICLGEGAPTVMLESGATIGAVAWRKVHGEIAGFTKVCAYDRAGYGFSDRIGRPSDARNAVDDLHLLIKRAGIKGPVVLVGHSAGGQYVQLFAATYPGMVAGMVLVAPTGLNEERDVDSILTPEERAEGEAEWPKTLVYRARCLDEALKAPASGATSTTCHYPRFRVPELDAEMLRQYSAAKSREAELSEMINFERPSPQSLEPLSRRQVQARPFHLGDRPLILIEGGARRPPGERGEQLKALSEQDDARLVSASTRGRKITVESGHIIQDDRPDDVISAVREVVETVRRRAR